MKGHEIIRSRRAVACAMCAATLAVAAPASAQEYVTNDSFREEQQARIQSIQLIADEAYAATFEIPAAWLPIEMLGVRTVMIADPNGAAPSSGYCGRYAIEVYEEPATMGGSCTDSTGFFMFDYKDAGAEIYSMTRQFMNNPLGFVVRADTGNYQDLLFSTINNDPSLNVTISPVILNTTRVRVALRAVDLACGAAQGQQFPIILTDADGIQADNFVDGYFAGGITATCPDRMNAPQTGQGWNWYDWRSFEPLASPLTSSGDYVMRLILDRNVVMPPDDMGMGGMDMGSGMADMGQDSGIVLVDVGPDGSIVDMHTGAEADAMLADMNMGGNGGDPDASGASDSGSGGGDPDASSGNTNNDSGDGLTLEAISPSSVDPGESTDVLILGEGFVSGLEVSLNARKIGVIEVASEKITATVPSDLEAGLYDVIVTNPDGETAILSQAFTVNGDGSGSGSGSGSGDNTGTNGGGVDAGCGCRSASSGPSGVPASLVGLLVFALAAVRRRTL